MEPGGGEVRDAIPDPVVVIDGTGAVVDVNRAARALFDVDDRHPAAPVGAVFEGYPSVVTTLETTEEGAREVTVADDGEPRDYRVTVTPVDGDEELAGGRVAVFRDLGEHREREHALEHARKRLQVLLDNLPTPVMYGPTSADGPWIDEVNPAFEEVFGLDADEVEGTRLDDHIVPEDVDNEEVNRKVVEEGGFEAEVRRKAADGIRDFHLQTAVVPRKDPDPETPYEGWAIYTDITERKRRERALRDREQQLDLLRQVLTRVIRHNIRNDVNVISIAADEIADSTEGRPAELAATIADRCEALGNYSEKAHRFSELADAGETTRRYDLADLARRHVEVARKRYPGASFELDVVVECTVEARAGLEVAVENILENAVEHDDGDDPTALVTVQEADDGVVLAVEDDGPGIPEQEVEVLAAEEETFLHHGSGIGLWLVDWIADASGADLTFERLASGTRVALRFPASSVDPEGVPAEAD